MSRDFEGELVGEATYQDYEGGFSGEREAYDDG